MAEEGPNEKSFVTNVLVAKELIRKVVKRYARQSLCPYVCSLHRGGALEIIIDLPIGFPINNIISFWGIADV